MKLLTKSNNCAILGHTGALFLLVATLLLPTPTQALLLYGTNGDVHDAGNRYVELGLTLQLGTITDGKFTPKSTTPLIYKPDEKMVVRLVAKTSPEGGYSRGADFYLRRLEYYLSLHRLNGNEKLPIHWEEDSPHNIKLPEGTTRLSGNTIIGGYRGDDFFNWTKNSDHTYTPTPSSTTFLINDPEIGTAMLLEQLDLGEAGMEAAGEYGLVLEFQEDGLGVARGNRNLRRLGLAGFYNGEDVTEIEEDYFFIFTTYTFTIAAKEVTAATAKTNRVMIGLGNVHEYVLSFILTDGGGDRLPMKATAFEFKFDPPELFDIIAAAEREKAVKFFLCSKENNGRCMEDYQMNGMPNTIVFNLESNIPNGGNATYRLRMETREEGISALSEIAEEMTVKLENITVSSGSSLFDPTTPTIQVVALPDLPATIQAANAFNEVNGNGLDAQDKDLEFFVNALDEKLLYEFSFMEGGDDGSDSVFSAFSFAVTSTSAVDQIFNLDTLNLEIEMDESTSTIALSWDMAVIRGRVVYTATFNSLLRIPSNETVTFRIKANITAVPDFEDNGRFRIRLDGYSQPTKPSASGTRHTGSPGLGSYRHTLMVKAPDKMEVEVLKDFTTKSGQQVKGRILIDPPSPTEEFSLSTTTTWFALRVQLKDEYGNKRDSLDSPTGEDTETALDALRFLGTNPHSYPFSFLPGWINPYKYKYDRNAFNVQYDKKDGTALIFTFHTKLGGVNLIKKGDIGVGSKIEPRTDETISGIEVTSVGGDNEIPVEFAPNDFIMMPFWNVEIFHHQVTYNAPPLYFQARTAWKNSEFNHILGRKKHFDLRGLATTVTLSADCQNCSATATRLNHEPKLIKLTSGGAIIRRLSIMPTLDNINIPGALTLKADLEGFTRSITLLEDVAVITLFTTASHAFNASDNNSLDVEDKDIEFEVEADQERLLYEFSFTEGGGDRSASVFSAFSFTVTSTSHVDSAFDFSSLHLEADLAGTANDIENIRLTTADTGDRRTYTATFSPQLEISRNADAIFRIKANIAEKPEFDDNEVFSIQLVGYDQPEIYHSSITRYAGSPGLRSYKHTLQVKEPAKAEIEVLKNYMTDSGPTPGKITIAPPSPDSYYELPPGPWFALKVQLQDEYGNDRDSAGTATATGKTKDEHYGDAKTVYDSLLFDGMNPSVPYNPNAFDVMHTGEMGTALIFTFFTKFLGANLINKGEIATFGSSISPRAGNIAGLEVSLLGDDNKVFIEFKPNHLDVTPTWNVRTLQHQVTSNAGAFRIQAQTVWKNERFRNEPEQKREFNLSGLSTTVTLSTECQNCSDTPPRLDHAPNPLKLTNGTAQLERLSITPTVDYGHISGSLTLKAHFEGSTRSITFLKEVEVVRPLVEIADAFYTGKEKELNPEGYYNEFEVEANQWYVIFEMSFKEDGEDGLPSFFSDFLFCTRQEAGEHLYLPFHRIYNVFAFQDLRFDIDLAGTINDRKNIHSPYSDSSLAIFYPQPPVQIPNGATATFTISVRTVERPEFIDKEILAVDLGEAFQPSLESFVGTQYNDSASWDNLRYRNILRVKPTHAKVTVLKHLTTESRTVKGKILINPTSPTEDFSLSEDTAWFGLRVQLQDAHGNDRDSADSSTGTDTQAILNALRFDGTNLSDPEEREEYGENIFDIRYVGKDGTALLFEAFISDGGVALANEEKINIVNSIIPRIGNISDIEVSLMGSDNEVPIEFVPNNFDVTPEWRVETLQHQATYNAGALRLQAQTSWKNSGFHDEPNQTKDFDLVGLSTTVTLSVTCQNCSYELDYAPNPLKLTNGTTQLDRLSITPTVKYGNISGSLTLKAHLESSTRSITLLKEVEVARPLVEFPDAFHIVKDNELEVEANQWQVIFEMSFKEGGEDDLPSALSGFLFLNGAGDSGFFSPNRIDNVFEFQDLRLDVDLAGTINDRKNILAYYHSDSSFFDFSIQPPLQISSGGTATFTIRARTVERPEFRDKEILPIRLSELSQLPLEIFLGTLYHQYNPNGFLSPEPYRSILRVKPTHAKVTVLKHFTTASRTVEGKILINPTSPTEDFSLSGDKVWFGLRVQLQDAHGNDRDSANSSTGTDTQAILNALRFNGVNPSDSSPTRYRENSFDVKYAGKDGTALLFEVFTVDGGIDLVNTGNIDFGSSIVPRTGNINGIEVSLVGGDNEIPIEFVPNDFDVTPEWRVETLQHQTTYNAGALRLQAQTSWKNSGFHDEPNQTKDFDLVGLSTTVTLSVTCQNCSYELDYAPNPLKLTNGTTQLDRLSITPTVNYGNISGSLTLKAHLEGSTRSITLLNEVEVARPLVEIADAFHTGKGNELEVEANQWKVIFEMSFKEIGEDGLPSALYALLFFNGFRNENDIPPNRINNVFEFQDLRLDVDLAGTINDRKNILAYYYSNGSFFDFPLRPTLQIPIGGTATFTIRARTVERPEFRDKEILPIGLNDLAQPSLTSFLGTLYHHPYDYDYNDLFPLGQYRSILRVKPTHAKVTVLKHFTTASRTVEGEILINPPSPTEDFSLPEDKAWFGLRVQLQDAHGNDRDSADSSTGTDTQAILNALKFNGVNPSDSSPTRYHENSFDVQYAGKDGTALLFEVFTVDGGVDLVNTGNIDFGSSIVPREGIISNIEISLVGDDNEIPIEFVPNDLIVTPAWSVETLRHQETYNAGALRLQAQTSWKNPGFHDEPNQTKDFDLVGLSTIVTLTATCPNQDCSAILDYAPKPLKLVNGVAQLERISITPTLDDVNIPGQLTLKARLEGSTRSITLLEEVEVMRPFVEVAGAFKIVADNTTSSFDVVADQERLLYEFSFTEGGEDGLDSVFSDFSFSVTSTSEVDQIFNLGASNLEIETAGSTSTIDLSWDRAVVRGRVVYTATFNSPLRIPSSETVTFRIKANIVAAPSFEDKEVFSIRLEGYGQPETHQPPGTRYTGLPELGSYRHTLRVERTSATVTILKASTTEPIAVKGKILINPSTPTEYFSLNENTAWFGLKVQLTDTHGNIRNSADTTVATGKTQQEHYGDAEFVHFSLRFDGVNPHVLYYAANFNLKHIGESETALLFEVSVPDGGRHLVNRGRIGPNSKITLREKNINDINNIDVSLAGDDREVPIEFVPNHFDVTPSWNVGALQHEATFNATNLRLRAQTVWKNGGFYYFPRKRTFTLSGLSTTVTLSANCQNCSITPPRLDYAPNPLKLTNGVAELERLSFTPTLINDNIPGSLTLKAHLEGFPRSITLLDAVDVVPLLADAANAFNGVNGNGLDTMDHDNIFEVVHGQRKVLYEFSFTENRGDTFSAEFSKMSFSVTAGPDVSGAFDLDSFRLNVDLAGTADDRQDIRLTTTNRGEERIYTATFSERLRVTNGTTATFSVSAMTTQSPQFTDKGHLYVSLHSFAQPSVKDFVGTPYTGELDLKKYRNILRVKPTSATVTILKDFITESKPVEGKIIIEPGSPIPEDFVLDEDTVWFGLKVQLKDAYGNERNSSGTKTATGKRGREHYGDAGLIHYSLRFDGVNPAAHYDVNDFHRRHIGTSGNALLFEVTVANGGVGLVERGNINPNSRITLREKNIHGRDFILEEGDNEVPFEFVPNRYGAATPWSLVSLSHQVQANVTTSNLSAQTVWRNSQFSSEQVFNVTEPGSVTFTVLCQGCTAEIRHSPNPLIVVNGAATLTSFSITPKLIYFDGWNRLSLLANMPNSATDIKLLDKMAVTRQLVRSDLDFNRDGQVNSDDKAIMNAYLSARGLILAATTKAQLENIAQRNVRGISDALLHRINVLWELGSLRKQLDFNRDGQVNSDDFIFIDHPLMRNPLPRLWSINIYEALEYYYNNYDRYYNHVDHPRLITQPNLSLTLNTNAYIAAYEKEVAATRKLKWILNRSSGGVRLRLLRRSDLDINLDGSVTATDATVFNNYVNHRAELNRIQSNSDAFVRQQELLNLSFNQIFGTPSSPGAHLPSTGRTREKAYERVRRLDEVWAADVLRAQMDFNLDGIVMDNRDKEIMKSYISVYPRLFPPIPEYYDLPPICGSNPWACAATTLPHLSEQQVKNIAFREVFGTSAVPGSRLPPDERTQERAYELLQRMNAIWARP